MLSAGHVPEAAYLYDVQGVGHERQAWTGHESELRADEADPAVRGEAAAGADESDDRLETSEDIQA